MADAAAARREARRKRILENSHNRLQLISGKCNEDCPRESPVRTIIPEPVQEISITSDHVSSGCINTPVNNGTILPESDTFDLLTFNHDIANHDIAAGDAELPDFTSFVLPPQEPVISQPPTSSFLEKLTNHRYDIVLLSIVIQLLFSLSLVTFEGTYFFY